MVLMENGYKKKMEKKTLLDAYRKARLELGISLHNAAKILDVDPCELLNFENGNSGMPENGKWEEHEKKCGEFRSRFLEELSENERI